MTIRSSLTEQPSAPAINLEDYQRAMLNILEDASEEKARLQETQRAILNVLEDFAAEKSRQEDTQRAALNILEDFSAEKARLGEMQRAALNILEDFAAEKSRLEDTQRAAINILEDFTGEKTRLEQTQRAMLNLLDDFDMEREKTEAANLQLRGTIDSLRRAKEAADAANYELEAFAYSVSHDLRAPLRSIAGFGDLLYEGYFDRLDEEGRDSLQRIIAATERMGQLIDDLLKLSRLTRTEMTRERHNLSEMARRIAEAKTKFEPDRKVELVIEPNLFAEVDEHLLGVVFENLLENAFKFTGKCELARIEFGLTSKDGKPTYFVKDNGTGFNMAYVGKLFQPFQRLHSANDFPGTGIGLATVRRIIQRHGGMVWIEGEKGKGATVYFTL
ncbi:MAG: GHKL domain-containing protein [Chloroflexota bacterium]|nr:MAG: GHKL domain-containing protein [Chloroflexota bacterium]